MFTRTYLWITGIVRWPNKGRASEKLGRGLTCKPIGGRNESPPSECLSFLVFLYPLCFVGIEGPRGSVLIPTLAKPMPGNPGELGCIFNSPSAYWAGDMLADLSPSSLTLAVSASCSTEPYHTETWARCSKRTLPRAHTVVAIFGFLIWASPLLCGTLCHCFICFLVLPFGIPTVGCSRWPQSLADVIVLFWRFAIAFLITCPFGWMEIPPLGLPELTAPPGMAPFPPRVQRSSCLGFLMPSHFFGSVVLSWTRIAWLGPAHLAWLLLTFPHSPKDFTLPPVHPTSSVLF